MLKDIMNSITHPMEIYAMVQAKRTLGKIDVPIKEGDVAKEFCYGILKKVSRSFAMVIMQLDGEVRDAICVFYLVLRALDTIEDDMSYPMEDKIPHLNAFYKRTEDPEWCLSGIKSDNPAETELVEKYYHVTELFQRLSPSLQEPIVDICRRMGEGMAEYIQKQGDVQTKEEYNRYCHYVAGLVGYGLSSLFAGSGDEDASLADEKELSNNMGLFLQKTNIIRDYLEDISEDPPRIFWPKEIWSNFTDDFHSLKDPENEEQARACLNAMVLDALQHIPDVLVYLSKLQTKSVFVFCAIPQVMAIATLTKLYNNINVFKGVVKIRKGEACQIMLDCGDMLAVRKWFHTFITEINTKLDPEDFSFPETRSLLRMIYLANRQALLREGVDMKHNSLTWSIITAHRALGGGFLFSLVDSLNGFLRGNTNELEAFDEGVLIEEENDEE